MNKLKIGIIGTGKVAETNYLPCLTQETDVLLGYFNRTPEKAKGIAEKFRGQVFDSVHSLMDWKPDTVFILTREIERYDVTLEILRDNPGRLFFEKPLVAKQGQEKVTEQDFYDAREIIHKTNAINCETAMIFNYRFFEHIKKAKRIIQDRNFGNLLNITALTHYACWSHVIDLIHFFAGPLRQISSLKGNTLHSTLSAGGMSANDIASSFITNEDATGTLIGTTKLPWVFSLFELSMIFENGRIRLQDLDGDLEVFSPDLKEVETHRLSNDLSRWDHYNSSFNKSITAYLNTIRDNKPAPISGIIGLMEMQVEAAIKRSISLGRPVNLDDEFPL